MAPAAAVLMRYAAAFMPLYVALSLPPADCRFRHRLSTTPCAADGDYASVCCRVTPHTLLMPL